MPTNPRAKAKAATRRAEELGLQLRCDKDVAERVAKVVETGAYISTACFAVGLTQDQYTNWMRRGRDALERAAVGAELSEEQERLAYFARRLTQAEADAEHALLGVISNAAMYREQWSAAAWILERSRPHRWGKRTEYYVAAGTVEEAKTPDATMAREFFETVMRAGSITGGTRTEPRAKSHQKAVMKARSEAEAKAGE